MNIGRLVSVTTSLALCISGFVGSPAQAATGTTPQTLTWDLTPAASAPLIYNSQWNLSASSDAYLPVTIGTNTPDVCTFDSGILTIVSGTGTCEYFAEQAGDTTYAPATSILEQVAVSKISQNLSFSSLADISDATTSVALTYSIDSPLNPVVTSDNPAVCTISGSNAQILGPGQCSITVLQPGNANYSAATPVNQTFLVTSSRPATPTNVWVERGSHQVTVHWNAVTNVGDAALDSYTAVATPSGKSCTTTEPSETSCVITELVDGTDYDFSVYATNIFGNSPSSIPANVGIAVDVPAWESPYGCGIDGAKKVVCWGDNAYGRATPPADLTDVKELGVGDAHSCALTEAGAVVCWGYGDGRSLVPSDLPLAQHLSVGDTRNCIITNTQSLSCFGASDSAYDIPSGLGPVTAVSAGYSDICVIKVGGQVECWGHDAGGIESNMPSNLDNVIDISVTIASACALKSDHSYVCWGSELPAQTAPAITEQIIQIGSSHYYTCALTTSGSLTCWGEDWWGRISRKPVDLPPVSSFAISRTHMCVTLRNGGGIRCWGWDGSQAVQVAGSLVYGSKLRMASVPSVPQNVFARRADNSVVISVEPPASDGGAPISSYVAITNGFPNNRCTIEPSDPGLACTITGLTNGRTYSFTVRAVNAAGVSKAAVPLDAINISGVSGYSQCAVLTNHNVTCWGRNMDVGAIRLLPSDLHNAVAVAMNGDQDGACAVTTSGTIRCWGWGWGVGSFEAGPGIPSDNGYIGITSTYYNFCAWKVNGDVTCWGWNGYNLVSGHGDIGPVSKVIGTHEHGYCAVLKDHTHACWGNTLSVDQSTAPEFVLDYAVSSNSWCAVDMTNSLTCGGDGNISNNIPSDIGLVKAVSLEISNACAVKMDDTVACWGSNNYGVNSVPSDMGPASNVFIGWVEGACAIRADGMPQCWGYAETLAPVPTGLTSIPGRVPQAPLAGARNTTNGVEVSWTAVTDNGGYAVSGYTATATPGGLSCTSTGTSCVIKGLNLGQSYSISVVATNEIGDSAPSIQTAPAVGLSIGGRDENYGCVITGGDRKIECWGGNNNGRATPPSDFKYVREIGLGADSGCAINDAGAVRCWGFNNGGQIPDGLDPVTKLSVGRYKTCVITTNHDLSCWAVNGAVAIPDTVGKVIDVSVGWEEICAVREDNSVTCWTENWGTLSDPDPAITDAKSIAVGQGTACAVRIGGTLQCWGDRANDWLPSDLGRVQKIDVALNGFCAVTVADQLRCWGDDWNNRFSNLPTNPGEVSDVQVNDAMTCVVLKDDKGVRCWGNTDLTWAGGVAPSWKYGSTVIASVQPSPPRNAVALFGDRKVTIHFDAPATNGGLPVTSYLVKARGTSSSCTVPGDAADLSCDLTGLTNGRTYSISVVARNDVGSSKSAATLQALDITGRRGLAYCVVTLEHKVACWGWVDNFGAKSSIPADLPLAKKVVMNWDVDSGCIITMQDTVRCWGGGWGAGNGDPVPTLSHVVQLEMGQYHTCALLQNGEVKCWGYSDSNRTNVPSDLGPVAKIFTSMSTTCALQRDGVIRCWGADLPPTEIESQFTDVVDMGIGDGEWCVIRSNNSLTCYGTNDWITNLPQDLGPVKSVALGDSNACAILMDNSGRCWGYNDWGKNEIPTTDGPISKIIPGREASSCLIETSGDISCWGYQGDSRNEISTTLTSKPGGAPSAPVIVSARNVARGVRVTWLAPFESGGYPAIGYTATAYPGNQSCTTTVTASNDGLTCIIPGISSGSHITVGVTATSLAGTSEIVSSHVNSVSVSTEFEHGCAATSEGSVRCWGKNDYGQTDVPLNLGTVVQVATSNEASCALNSSGEVHCWGAPGYGATVPVDLGPVSKITMGTYHVCALMTDTSVRCWGQNDQGQSGIPADTSGVLDIEANQLSTCVIFSDHSSTCYGAVHTAPDDLGGVLQLSADQWHTCAMQLDHSLRCWGDGWAYVPQEFTVANTIKEVQVDWATTCVIKTDDTATCWGYRGDLGSQNLGTVKSISQGWQSLCALTLSDRVVCSGEIDRVRAIPAVLVPDTTLDVAYPPTSPRSISSIVVDNSVIVSWQEPISDGGSAITGYTAYIPQTNDTCVKSAEDEDPFTCTLTKPNLENYDVIVYATNETGNSLHFTFNAPKKQQMYFNPYSVYATASDGEVVSMVSQTGDVCQVLSSSAGNGGSSISKISLLKPGKCTLTASVPLGAPDVTRSFTVKAAHRFSGLTYKVMYFDRNVRWSDDGRAVCAEGVTPLIDSASTWINGSLFGTNCQVEDFMIHYSGSITWPGVYDGTTTSDVVFHSVSDDGFHLEIDGEVVIDDPSYHGDQGPTSAAITHLAGKAYPIDAWMFQGCCGYSSRLFWDLNDGNGEVIVPASAFVSDNSLPKETQALTWSDTTAALESGRVGQIFTLEATSDADASEISYGTTTEDTCEITGDAMNQVKIIDDSGPCTFQALSDETNDLQAATPIQHTITTMAGYGVTITETDLFGSVPYFINGYDPNTGATVENTRTVSGVSNVLDPLNHTVEILCVPQDRDLNPISIATGIELSENGEFSATVEVPRNIGGVAGCKLTGAITGEAVLHSWDDIESDPIRPFFIGATLTNDELTNMSIDYWGTSGYASFGLDWACPLCAMYAADDHGSFAVANQRDPLSIDASHHSLWNYAGTHNPTAVNDNFKLTDPNDPNSTIDYSDFTVDDQPVFTAKMALDLGTYTDGSDRPQINVRYSTDEHTGALIVSEQSQLWQCTTDGKKLWSTDCGEIVEAPVALNRITTIQPTGTEYFIEDSYVSTDGRSHTLVTASEMHTTNPENLQFKVTSGIAQPMTNFSEVDPNQNILGTGSSMNILTKFDGLGESQDNTTLGSASFSPSPTRLVTANNGPTETSSYGMNVVYDNQQIPANGNALVLRQAYTIARDVPNLNEGLLSAASYLVSGKSTLGQTITFSDMADEPFTNRTTNVEAESTAALLVSFASTTPTVCTVGASTKQGRISRALVTYVGAGTCHLNATQAGNDYFRSATGSTEFTVLLEAPSIPRNVSATVTGNKVILKWTNPLNTGGSAIAKYVATATSGIEVKSVTVNKVGNSVAPTTATLTTLRPGVTYRVTLTATNTAVGLQTAKSSSATVAVSVKLPSVIYVSGMKWTVVGNKPVKVGNSLSATKGAWLGTGVTYKYQWYRCGKIFATPGTTGVAVTYPKAGAGKCVAIAKATAASYKLTAADKGKFIMLSTKAVNTGLPAGVTMYTKSTAAVK